MSCDDLIFCKTMSYDILRFSHFAKQWVVMLWSFKKKKWYFYILQNNKLWHFDIFQQWYSNIFIFSKTGSSDTLIILHFVLHYSDTFTLEIAVWLLRLQSDCWDGCLIAEIAVWFWKWVKIRGPEIEASHWLRAQNWGLCLVKRTGF